MQSGLVSVQVASPTGRRLIVAIFGEEDVLGEMALAGVPRRTASVVAVRDADVLMLDAHRLRELRAATLEVDVAIMGVLADTVRRLTAQLLEATLISQPVRLRRSCCGCIATTTTAGSRSLTTTWRRGSMPSARP